MVQLLLQFLEKENAVDDFRTLIGATNPAEAAEGTIRKMYATSLEKTQFTVQIAMKMQLSKVLSILQEESNSSIQWLDFSVQSNFLT